MPLVTRVEVSACFMLFLARDNYCVLRRRGGSVLTVIAAVYAPHGRDVRTLRCLGGRVCGPVRSLDRRLRAAYSRLCSSYQLGRLIAPQVPNDIPGEGSRPGRAAVRIAWETQPTGHTHSVAGALIRGGGCVRRRLQPTGPAYPSRRGACMAQMNGPSQDNEVH